MSANWSPLQFAFRFLARIWVREIDETLLDELAQPEIKTAFEQAGGFVPEKDEKAIERLAIDYCQLLIGPQDPISPVQSVWAENQYEGQPAASISEYFKMQ